VRRIAQQPGSRQHDTAVAFYLHTATSTIGALLVAAISLFFAASFIDVRLLYIALISVVTAPAQAALMSFFRGREQHVLYAWANAGQVVVVTVGGVLALVAGMDVRAFALISAALSALSTLACWKLAGFWPTLPSIDLTFLRELQQFIRGGFPFLMWNISSIVYATSDRVLLGFFVAPSEIGWYSAALRIVGVTIFIPTIIVAPLFPALSRSVCEPSALRRAVAQTFRLSLVLTVPLSAGIIAIASALPAVLGWPTDFANAVPLMMILAVHIPIVAIDMVLATVIMAIGRESRWVRVGLLAAPFNIGLNLIAIPLTEQLFGLGVVGASITTVLTEILMFFGALIVLPKNLLDPRLVSYTLRVVGAGLATWLAATAALPLGLPVAVIAGAIAYPLVLVLVRGIDLDDARYVLQRVTKRAPAT